MKTLVGSPDDFDRNKKGQDFKERTIGGMDKNRATRSMYFHTATNAGKTFKNDRQFSLSPLKEFK